MSAAAGGSIIEQLVRCPPLRVRAWKLTSSSTRDVIRDTLLQVRQLAINNVVVMTTNDVTGVVFSVVSSSLQTRNVWQSLAYSQSLFCTVGLRVTNRRVSGPLLQFSRC